MAWVPVEMTFVERTPDPDGDGYRYRARGPSGDLVVDSDDLFEVGDVVQLYITDHGPSEPET